MKNTFAKILLAALILSVLILTAILQTTTPSQAGATGILSVFILAYIIIVCALTFFMYTIARIIVVTSRLVAMRKPLTAMSLKRAYYFSSVVGLAPVIIVSMQSVGSFGLYELGLIALLVAIGCVYVTKRTT